MERFILWCGFAGAWLLFAGPIFQAALELREQEMARAEIEAAAALVDDEPPISPWWWLLPPVFYWLNHRRSERMHEAVMKVLTPEQMRGLIDYVNKATGWFFVGAGGLLLAAKETWELCENYEWSVAVYWPLAALMAVASVANAVGRIVRGRQTVDRHRAAADAT